MDLSRRTLMGGIGAVLGGSGLATATGADILSTGQESPSDEQSDEEEDDDDESVPKSDVSLSKQEAKNVATDEVSGTVQSVELESEDGTPVYEVTVKTPGGAIKEVPFDALTVTS